MAKIRGSFSPACYYSEVEGIFRIHVVECFSWDARSRGHIWEPETRQERTQATNDLAQRNAARIDSDRQQWELTTAMRRTGLRNIGGRRPIFRHDASIGAYVRAENRSGGIDWYRYETGFNPLD
jgi:hypothetical protein